MWTCVDMNGIAPIENGLVSRRATSRPAAVDDREVRRACRRRSGSVTHPIRRTVPSPSNGCAYMHGPAGQRSPSTSSSRLVRLVAEQVELLEPRLEAELPERVRDHGRRRATAVVAPGGARADVDCERLDQVHEPSLEPAAHEYDHRVRPRPARLERLPQQYFVALLGRVAAAAAEAGPPLVDLGRGNPELGPPAHVVEALVESARASRRPRLRADPRARAHARGDRGALPRRLRRRARSRARGRGRSRARRPAIVELALVLADEGDTVLLPDPYYPDYPSGPALAGARLETFPLRRRRGLGAGPRRRRRRPRRSTSTTRRTRARSARPTACSPTRSRWAERTGGAVVHDAAYIDLVFDGRAPGELPRDAGREGRRRRDVVDVEDVRHGGLAHRLRRRQRRDRRAHQPAERPRRASGSSRRCSARRSPRSKGRRTRSPTRVATYERRRDAARRARCRRRSSARGRSSSGCACPKG